MHSTFVKSKKNASDVLQAVNKNKSGIESLVSKAFNLSYLKSVRYKWIDYIKGIAILLVVYRHALIGIQRSHIVVPDYLIKANMIFYSFRMPLFFILSGLFISASFQKKSLKELITTKFDMLLYPYFVWCFIQITIQIILSSYTNSGRTLHDYLYIFYQPRELDQFWYLPALFNVSVLYLLIKSKFKATASHQLLIGLIFYTIAPFFSEISIIGDWMEFYIFFALGDFLSKAFFKGWLAKILNKAWLLALVIPFFVISQLYYLQFPEAYFYEALRGRLEFILIALTGCGFMFALAFQIQAAGVLNFLRIIGCHSLQIYALHVIAVAFARIVLIQVIGITNPFILLFTGITFGTLAAIVFYNLFIKNGILWFLFSFRKTKEAV